MADQKSDKVVLGMSTTAAVAAVMAWIAASKKVGAAPGDGTIPSEVVELIVAIALSADHVDQNTLDIINAVNELSLGSGRGWPENAIGIRSLRVQIVPTGTQLPDVLIPDGMALVIKAWPLNPGWLQVGESLSASGSLNQSWPLIPNEIVWYNVKNANQIYVGANAAGCFANLTVEQKGGGG